MEVVMAADIVVDTAVDMVVCVEDMVGCTMALPIMIMEVV